MTNKSDESDAHKYRLQQAAEIFQLFKEDLTIEVARILGVGPSLAFRRSFWRNVGTLGYDRAASRRETRASR
jgi:hypothetical protein